MICQQCKEQGLKSTIGMNGGCRGSTLMNCNPNYDEESVLHYHDYKTRIYYYKCSNGHNFEKIYYNYCLCGWTNDPSAREIK